MKTVLIVILLLVITYILTNINQTIITQERNFMRTTYNGEYYIEDDLPLVTVYGGGIERMD